MAEERRYLLSKQKLDASNDDDDGQRFTKSESVLFTKTSKHYAKLEDAHVKLPLWNKVITNGTVVTRLENNTSASTSLILQCGVVFACLVTILLSMGLGYSLSVLYAELIRVFETERSVVALNQSFYEALLAVGGALWSFPVSKLGYGYSIMIGGVAGSICVGLSSFATNVPTIIIFVGIMSGAAFGVVYMGPFVVAGDVFNSHKKAVIGFVSIGSSLGQFTMSYIMETCIESYGWNGALLILGAVCLNAVPCGMLMVIIQNRAPINVEGKNSASAKRSLFKFELFKGKLFWLLMLNSVILAFTALAESRFLVDIAQLKGFTRSQGSLLISMIGVTNLVGGLTGALSKMVCKLSSAAHMSYWMVIIAVSHGMVVYLDTYPGLLAAALVNGLCIGAIYAHVAVAMYEIYGTEDYAPSFATWNVLKGVGNFLGGFLGGTIQDKTGSYDLLFRISMILSLFYAFSFAGICIYRRRSQSTYTLIK